MALQSSSLSVTRGPSRGSAITRRRAPLGPLPRALAEAGLTGPGSAPLDTVEVEELCDHCKGHSEEAA